MNIHQSIANEIIKLLKGAYPKMDVYLEEIFDTDDLDTQADSISERKDNYGTWITTN